MCGSCGSGARRSSLEHTLSARRLKLVQSFRGGLLGDPLFLRALEPQSRAARSAFFGEDYGFCNRIFYWIKRRWIYRLPRNHGANGFMMSLAKFQRCSYAICKTGLPGIVIPVASFLPLPVDGKPVPAYMPRGHAVMSDLRLCESCALTARVQFLVHDKRWAEICRQIAAAGGSPPDRESLQLLLGSPKNQPLPESFKQAVQKLRKESLI